MKTPEADIQQAINDPRLQLAIYTATGRLIDHRAAVVSAEALPDYQALRNEANAIKKHTIENLDYYLEQLESNVIAHGGKVILLPQRRGSSRLRSRSGEEARLAHAGEIEIHDQRRDSFQRAPGRHHLEAVETDLGEYILQLAHQRPYHIVAPALHLTRYDVADVFTKELGVENEVVIEKQTKSRAAFCARNSSKRASESAARIS
jgi:L-lactate dehydrogenase complex protein LldF